MGTGEYGLLGPAGGGGRVSAPTDIDWESPEGFLTARVDWLRVAQVRTRDGGIDIALIIDGTYAADQDLTALVAYFDELLAKVKSTLRRVS